MPVTDGIIILPPDSNGKILDCSQVTVGANTVQRERLNIADPVNNNYANVSAAGAVQVDGSAVTQPISGAVSFTAPQHVINDASTSVIGHIIVDSGTTAVTQGTAANLNATVVGTGTFAAQVTGSVTANAGTNLNTSALATQASLVATQVAGGGTTAPATVQIVGGKTNDATAQYDLLPLGAGGRSVIIEGVASGTAVPVSLASAPTTSVTQGTSPWVVGQGTAANLNATVVGTGTFAVQATLAAETTKVIGTVNQGTSPWVVGQGTAANLNATVVGTGTFATQSTISGNGAVLSSQQAVTGSAVVLASNATKNVCIKALAANTINVYVGPSGITTSTGFELTPGTGVCMDVSNTNLLFVIASTTGASVSWIATN